MKCPCGTALEFDDCCAKVHLNLDHARSAEMLMRARYSAFVVHNIDFLYTTFHPSTRRFQSRGDIQSWANECKWMHLEIVSSSANKVEFKAHYMDLAMNVHVHHEKSNFEKIENNWYYVDGILI